MTVDDHDLPALEVVLRSSVSGQLLLPESVVIPENEASVGFDVQIIDDAISDGPITVSLVPSAPGYISAPTEILVLDDEPSQLAIEVSHLEISERQPICPALIN